jgi:hypothetical protein
VAISGNARLQTPRFSHFAWRTGSLVWPPFMATRLLLCLILVTGPRLQSTAEDSLAAGFSSPPASARPWVYWFFVDGNISREGITADLESMKRAGVGGAILFDVSQQLPAGHVGFGTAEWHDLLKHVFAEAGRMGLQVFVQNSAGWTGSGGPWITPDASMQVLGSTKTNVVGPMRFADALPTSSIGATQFNRVATIAFPTLVGEGATVPGFSPKVTASSGKNFEAHNLIDHNPETAISLNVPSAHRPQYLQFDFADSFNAARFELMCLGKPQQFEGCLQISDDRRHFRTIREFINRGKVLRIEFEPVSARSFRWLFKTADPSLSQLRFAELDLTPVWRIPIARAKAGEGPLPAEAKEFRAGQAVPDYCEIFPTNVVDLSSKCGADGRITWDVPAGPWTIMQFLDVPNGRGNHPARAGGVGLECDKLGREGIQAQFKGFFEPLLKDAGTNAGKSLAGVHVDSWEVGFQNWTKSFAEEFRKRRGYDLTAYLPATTGRIIGSMEQSARFLWDMRRTIADLEAENYAGELARIAHSHGLQLSIEPFASISSGPFDELLYADAADIPMGEFWLQNTPLDQLSLKATPSAAHAAGRPIVAVEAFTSYPAYAKWQNHPYLLKPVADAAFCEGINRLVFHRFTHQPWTNLAPGLTLGPFGLHYERTTTWWEESRPWHDYISRCQFLLQSGVFVADVCYLTEEGAFTTVPRRDQLRPQPVYGNDYDVLAPQLVIDRMQVKDGRLMLPGGASYMLLVLPVSDRMTPALLKKIKELVEAGATVLGPKPNKSPSLAGYPSCDAEVNSIANELWGPCDGVRIKEHSFGKGKIIFGKSVREALSPTTPLDFQQITTASGSGLRYIHRRLDDADIYFVANPNGASNGNSTPIECAFRVPGKQPEIWHPETGLIERPARWREEGGKQILPLSLEPWGSQFVVFRQSVAGADPVVTASINGSSSGGISLLVAPTGTVQCIASQNGEYKATTRSGRTLTGHTGLLPEPLEIGGPWQVHFPSKSGAPNETTFDHLISWTEHTDPAIKYFSGEASYTKTIFIPDAFIQLKRRVLLDLGTVQVIARVKINGVDGDVFWKPPFVADISALVHKGNNTLEIKVVNLWPNRLIGDEQLPDDCEWLPAQGELGQPLARWPEWLLKNQPRPTGRKAFAAWKHWKRDDRLLESGLRGPVVLRAADEITLE